MNDQYEDNYGSCEICGDYEELGPYSPWQHICEKCFALFDARSMSTYLPLKFDESAIAGFSEPKKTQLLTALHEQKIYQKSPEKFLANPSNRACETCEYFEYKPCCSYGSDECGCKGLNDCHNPDEAVTFIAFGHDGWPECVPTENGYWSGYVDHRINCPGYKQKVEDNGNLLG